jgi:hypothetical protein
MNFFMIEWWDVRMTKYQQEYFRSMESAAARFIMLRDDVPESNPAIETLFLNQD